MSNKSDFSIISLLFGAPPKEGSPTESYQRRQNKLVQSGSPIAMIFWTSIVYTASSKNIAIGIAAAFFIIYFKLFYCIAASSDAIFDSIWERLNLQSKWLDFRLHHIESKLDQRSEVAASQDAGYQSGRAYWDEHFNIDLNESYYDYPERHKKVIE